MIVLRQGMGTGTAVSDAVTQGAVPTTSIRPVKLIKDTALAC
jgi:hypothetical protein